MMLPQSDFKLAPVDYSKPPPIQVRLGGDSADQAVVQVHCWGRASQTWWQARRGRIHSWSAHALLRSHPPSAAQVAAFSSSSAKCSGQPVLSLFCCFTDQGGLPSDDSAFPGDVHSVVLCAA